MAKRATISDVAELAGVGVATVDRVLNGRSAVRARTAERVMVAAQSLNYHAHGLLRRRIEEMAPAKSLGFILQKRGKWFYQALAADLRAAAEAQHDIRASVEIAFVETLTPDGLIAALKQMAGQVDAIAIVALDHPAVVAEIRAVVASGIPVFAMLSDLSSPAHSGYIGVDGRKAGRTAGWAMARSVPGDGEVGILIGSHRYLGQEDRETGFRSYMREHASNVCLRDSVIYMDEASIAYEATAEILRASPGLAGIYHCGGGVEGALQALSEADRGADVFYVCHENSPCAIQALADGGADLILVSPTAEIAHHTVAEIVNSLTASGGEQPRIYVPFQILTPENL
mgnify:CR=1 FL=1